MTIYNISDFKDDDGADGEEIEIIVEGGNGNGSSDYYDGNGNGNGSQDPEELLKRYRSQSPIRGPFILGRILCLLGSFLLAFAALVMALAVVGGILFAAVSLFRSPVLNGRVRGYWAVFKLFIVLSALALLAVLSPTLALQVLIIYLIGHADESMASFMLNRFR